MFVELHPRYAELVKGIKACLNVEFARTSLRSFVTSDRIGTGHFAIPAEVSLLSFRHHCRRCGGELTNGVPSWWRDDLKPRMGAMVL